MRGRVVCYSSHMAWTYSDYESQDTDSDRLSRLRLHIAEVSAAISAAMTSAGNSRDPQVLQRYMEETLQRRRRELEAKVGSVDASDKRKTASFTRARPV